MDRDDQQARITRLLADLEAAGEGPDVLDPNDVARLAAGRPSTSAREAILDRLGAEDAAVAASVASAASARKTRSARPRQTYFLAAAAALALAVGATLLFLSREAGPLADEDLIASFARLHEADPQVFDGVDPILDAERSNGLAPVRRGGLAILGPQGAILDRRPALRWEAVTGAADYALEILSDEGEIALAATTTDARLDWPAETPPLVSGTEYVLRVASRVAGVRVESTRAFRVPGAEEQSRYDRALTTVSRSVSSDLQSVVRAQVALRFGLLEEATAHLDGAESERARTLIEETRAYVDRRRGVR